MSRLSVAKRLAVTVVVGTAMLAPGPAGPETPPPGSRRPIPGGPLRAVSLPDLRVEVAHQTFEHCAGAPFKISILAKVRNDGPGDASLPAEWTKPWVTAYPSVKLPNFVQPYYTGGKATLLKPGKDTVVEFGATFTDPVGGGAWDVIVAVDPKNVIKEVNENNNTGKFVVTACKK